ncbi:MAG: hypothetical protein CL799_06840 [Chromatiales bacterium]|nr:hypothetical protein [Chromatiales bacterium]MDP6151188.1 hypothetical protein [Gammaproteobacteria bacterium]MDP7093763.1 hypothetical protein [Gammaproteobacteria bacterium]MDP7271470.1 hypothetical protein [Gammaproteobacteria bacterium]HJP04989.1 hypothetical protein [Gammaproteobacteria bacterium]
MDAENLLEAFGNSIEERIKNNLGGVPSDKHADVAEIKNLASEITGHANVYDADKLDKAACLSIDIAPGVRYFNIHIIPESRYNIPRFLLEGMLSTRGSQISTDILPDIDMAMNIVALKEQFVGVEAAFNDAKQGDITFEPSRQTHMRTFCSPFFLCTFGIPADQMEQMDAIANGYFDEWLKLYNNAVELDQATADERQARRAHMAKMVVELDPDRNMVVQVYGEKTIQAIEAALII